MRVRRPWVWEKERVRRWEDVRVRRIRTRRVGDSWRIVSTRAGMARRERADMQWERVA